jgi:signal peptidase I
MMTQTEPDIDSNHYTDIESPDQSAILDSFGVIESPEDLSTTGDRSEPIVGSALNEARNGDITVSDALSDLSGSAKAEAIEAQSGKDTKPGPRGRNRRGRGLARVIAEWVAIITVALSVALLVRATVVQAFWIPSTSMTPTLKVGDRLLVDKVSFQVREIHRGEIIVFERPATLKEDFKDLIKRVIGLPGDTVEGHDGAVFVNGKRLPEPYLPAGLTTKDFAPQRVPIDNYFVMGDNREVSWDSRYWGTVERKLVVGKAIVRVWPPSQIGRL